MPSTTFPNHRTLNDVLFLIAEAHSDDVMRVQAKDGSWSALSSAQVYARVRAFALALENLGLRKGDRVVLLSENRWEWAVTDFACLALGLVDVPLFPTLQAEQVGELIAHSGARVAVVSTKAQREKIEAVQSRTALEYVIVMDDDAVTGDALSFSSLIAGADAEGARDALFDERARLIQPDDLASIIYTSGTTGEPKGVVLTHGNLASNVNYSLREFTFTGPQRAVSFLPLSHSTARHVDYVLYTLGFSIAYCPSMDKLMGALKTVQPTLIVSVPRIFEKVRQEIERRSRGSRLKSGIVAWALGVGKRHERTVLEGKTPTSLDWKLADRLFFSKVRAVFGGEATYAVAGGAPLGPDTAHWFAQVGIRILEGYGLTETSPVIGVNTPLHYRMGTIGRPLANIQVRTAADSELLVKGPSVFSRYWNSPALTAEAFDEEGWFRTGDIAELDEDGFIRITDRKKELIKTSAGKYVAPQGIEGRLKADLFVGNAAVLGDRQKYVAALISPNFAVLEPWAREKKIPAETRRELVEHPLVVARYKEVVRQVNRSLADFELLKRFAVVAEEWAIDTGELTPSMKLKRRVLNERYQEQISGLFR
jgi:long-chain acyl-CoA synthetase